MIGRINNKEITLAIECQTFRVAELQINNHNKQKISLKFRISCILIKKRKRYINMEEIMNKSHLLSAT